MQCKKCLEKFDTIKQLSTHIRYVHNMSTKDYYDMYVKQQVDGICQICGEQTLYRNLEFGYRKLCSSKQCKSKFTAAHRATIAKDPVKHSKFIAKVSANQKSIWKERKKTGADKIIRSKIGNTIKQKNAKKSAAELKNIYRWLNKLSLSEKEQWKNEVMFNTGMFKWWNEASDEDKLMVLFKRESTKKNISIELVREYKQNPTNKELYYAAVSYLTEQTYQIHKDKIDPDNKRGKLWHLDHKYSVFQGFIDNIPPEIIAHRDNLICIPAKNNLSKGPNRSISQKELLEAYNSDPYFERIKHG